MKNRTRFVSALFLPSAAAMSLLVLGGGGSFAAVQPPTASCAPDGTALAITASDNRYDKTCLAAPANQAFTIDFDNEDSGIPHNVSIYDKDHGNKALFTGDIVDGPKKIRYSVSAIPAGTYEFRCDPHPEFMFGTFNVS
jgi:plastocyanin